MKSYWTLENSLKFPNSRASLWDSTPIGDVLDLNLSYRHRNPRVLVLEKALRLAHKHAQQSSKTNLCCFFLGTIAVDSDEEGVTLTLDRFDPGREQPDKSGNVPTALLPQDVLVPFEFVTSGGTSSESGLHSAEELHDASKMLKLSCSGREPLDLSKLLSLRAHLRCSQLDNLDFVMQWTALTLGNTLNMVPIRPIPIIPTALARSLRFPGNVAEPTHRCTQKQGFLTMDETRKLLLILESDPKAYTLPVVGVWLSGLSHITNPVVWAWCLRFLLNSALQDRVLVDGRCFLVVLFSLTHRDPEVYQCQPVRHQQDVAYKLFNSSKSFTLYKNVDVSEGRVLTFELSEDRQKVFRELLSQASLTSGSSVTDQDSGVEDEDLSPRPSPNPHPPSQQTKRVHPLVPELSMVMDSSFKETQRIGSDDLYTPHRTCLDLQQRGTAPAQQIHSGIRVPVQVSPLVRPTHSHIIPQMKGQTNANMQQLVYSNKKKRSPFAKKASDKRPAQSSLSSPRSRDPRFWIGDSFRYSTQDVCSGASRMVFPMFSPHLHSQDCSQGADAPPAAMHSHKQDTDYPKHFQSTPNSNMNQPCPCCSPHPYNYTPICCTSKSDGTATVPPMLTYRNTSGPLQIRPATCQSVNGALSSDLAASKPHTYDLTAQLQYNPNNTPHRREHIENPPFNHPCYQAQAPPVALQSFQPQDGPGGIFPANGYQILIEQDRQLKSLQSQILELLASQGKEGRGGPSTGQTHIPSLPEQPSVKSVSVAVGTGASIFCNNNPVHADTRKDSQQDLPTDSELGIQDDCSRIPYDCAYLPKRQLEGAQKSESKEAEQPSYCNQSRSKGLHEMSVQSPVLGESASMHYHSPASKQDNPHLPQTRTQEDRFKEDSLDQVNSLQSSINGEVQKDDDEGNKILPENLCLSPEETQSSADGVTLCRTNKSISIGLEDTGEPIHCATLIQLQRLGVSVDVESVPPYKARPSFVASSSTLASINPAAFLSRMSPPESVSASLWFPGGNVDLSLEANAIALKYLNDSQLSKLSLGSQAPLDHQRNLSALLPRKPLSERNTMDTSFPSPNNMSMATKKYMKRYGLIEDWSDEEEEEQNRDDVVSDQERGQWEVSDMPDPTLGLVPKTIPSEGHRAPLFPQAGPLDTQSQLLNDLRPKMQLLACMTKQRSGQESNARWQPSVSERRRSSPTPEGSVGNFLDLSRLRQLPKLF